jgi:queuine tRNA-ribosyltransferase
MFEFKLENTDIYARAWKFRTEHGVIETPIFMPVWTKASVKWISNEDLDEMWAQIILNNTYHLYLRPWDEIIKYFGWCHSFMNYKKPILTDSWWFQVFSLGNQKYSPHSISPKGREATSINIPSPLGRGLGWGLWLGWGQNLVKITEDWVHFRSYIDGSKHFFNAENVMDIQSNIWADIIMAFDECAPWDSTYQYAKKAMKRTHDWAERCVTRWKENNKIREKQWLHKQALFPIVQWVIFDDLRIESAKFIWNLDTPWVAIWWLSVWESKEDMYRILDIMKDNLPENKPRYLMWVWTPEDLIEAISRWIDMFDCVLPTRLWRHWVAFSSIWNIKIKNEIWKLSKEPLDKLCKCKVCKNYTKWYLRHLIQENEIQWMQLLSYHNLFFLINLCKKARTAIKKNKFEDFKENFWKKYWH